MSHQFTTSISSPNKKKFKQTPLPINSNSNNCISNISNNNKNIYMEPKHDEDEFLSSDDGEITQKQRFDDDDDDFNKSNNNNNNDISSDGIYSGSSDDNGNQDDSKEKKTKNLENILCKDFDDDDDSYEQQQQAQQNNNGSYDEDDGFMAVDRMLESSDEDYDEDGDNEEVSSDDELDTDNKTMVEYEYQDQDQYVDDSIEGNCHSDGDDDSQFKLLIENGDGNNDGNNIDGLDNEGNEITKNIYIRAKEALHLSAVPDRLPGREKEKATITAFIEAKLRGNESGGCLYIAGMPGTGKTATVKEIIKDLLEKRRKKTVNRFQFIEINGMQLTEPHQLYPILYNKMQKTRKSSHSKKISTQDALRLIQRNFDQKTRRKEFRIVLVDEFDNLITKKQTVIYNLFEWPNKPNSKLIIIAIANTMNLPDTLLPRVKSRMGLQKVPFTPYNIHQLETIIKYRLDGLEAFDQDSISICSKRVAAVCGDARRALEICRKAATIADYEYKKLILKIYQSVSNDTNTTIDRPILPKPGKITVDHIEEVFEQFSSPLLRKLNQLSFYEKFFLFSLCKEIQFTNTQEIQYGSICIRMRILSRKVNIIYPNQTQILQLLGNLTGARFILCNDDDRHTTNNWDQLIKLNLQIEDLLFGLEQDLDLKILNDSNN